MQTSNELSRALLREKFKQQTTINVIGKAVSAEHLAENVFWIILLLGCIFMTYRDCEPPIRAYLSEDTVSVVQLILNQTIAFPGAILCVNIPLSLLNVRNASRLTDTATLRVFSDCLHSDECAKRREFYDDFYDEIAATIKVLSSYVVAEVGKITQINATNSIAFEDPESFYRFLLETKLSVEQLIDRITFAVCAKFAFEVEKWHKTNRESFNFCETTSATWFGVPPETTDSSETVCYGVTNFTNVSSPEDRHIFSFVTEGLSYGSDLADVRLEGLFDANLNLANAPITTDRSSSHVTIKSGECTEVDARIAFRVRSLPKRRQPCSATQTQSECRGYCRVSSLRDACNCTSVSWLKALEYDEQLAPSCFSAFSAKSFSTMALYAKNIPSAKACRKHCDTESVSCEQTLMTLASKPCVHSWQQRNGSTTIELRVKQFSYVYCEESLSMSFPTLISALGGVLGLWLEAGFVGVVHLFVFPIVMVGGWLVQRKGTASDGDEEKAQPVVAIADDDVVKTRLSALELRVHTVEGLLAKVAAKLQVEEES